jgi:seryl-tRNA synthetase
VRHARFAHSVEAALTKQARKALEFLPVSEHGPTFLSRSVKETGMCRKSREATSKTAVKAAEPEDMIASAIQLKRRFEDLSRDFEAFVESAEKDRAQNAQHIGEIEGELADTRIELREIKDELRDARAQIARLTTAISIARNAFDAAERSGVAVDDKPGDTEEPKDFSHSGMAVPEETGAPTQVPGAGAIAPPINRIEQMSIVLEAPEVMALDELACAHGYPGREALITDMIRQFLLSPDGLDAALLPEARARIVHAPGSKVLIDNTPTGTPTGPW